MEQPASQNQAHRGLGRTAKRRVPVVNESLEPPHMEWCKLVGRYVRYLFLMKGNGDFAPAFDMGRAQPVLRARLGAWIVSTAAQGDPANSERTRSAVARVERAIGFFEDAIARERRCPWDATGGSSQWLDDAERAIQDVWAVGPYLRPDAPNAEAIARLTLAQRSIWDALYRRSLTSPQLAEAIGKRATAEAWIRKEVMKMRPKGFAIEVHGRGGYFRRDAPPLGDGTSPTLQEITGRERIRVDVSGTLSKSVASRRALGERNGIPPHPDLENRARPVQPKEGTQARRLRVRGPEKEHA